jgi:hypothetical protein
MGPSTRVLFRDRPIRTNFAAAVTNVPGQAGAGDPGHPADGTLTGGR